MSSQEDTNDSPEKRNKQNSFHWSRLINFLALIIVIAISGYNSYEIFLYKNKVDSLVLEKNSKNTEFVSLQKSINKNTASILDVKANLQSKLNHTDKDESNEYYTELKSRIQKLENKKSDTTTNFAVLEIDYLLRIAHYYLYFIKDIDTTILLLEQANKRISNIKDSGFSEVYYAIKEKISQLKLIPNNNRKDIILKLDNIYSEIKKISLSELFTEYQVKEKREPENTTQRLWQEVSKFISIRKNEKPLKLSVSKEYKNYLYHYLYQQIKITQSAVLQFDQVGYTIGLENIRKHIVDYFLIHEEASKNILKNLNELEKIILLPDIPDISNLPELLRNKNQLTGYSSGRVE